ncbi:hypothetical protein H5T87_11190, partial [bacterium]|nr:hypothetical protein [bacterium]
MADPISVKLHARWTPDLTANPQQPQCVSSGTVAGGVEFHLVVNYGSVQNEGAVINVSCHYIDILEQTNVHEPQHFRVDNPGGTAYTPEQISSICSDPPRGYQNYIVFSTPPFWGFACHNTSYVVKAAYSYTKVGPGGPPPQYRRVGPIELSITVNFQNLVVNAQPKFLKWDRSYPDNNDTTISFSLSSAQKKNCDVTIEIYPVDGTFPIYTTRLVVPCPGSATFQWDGTMNQSGVPPGTLAPTGIYTFDIIAVGACPYDQDRMRSANLSLSNVAVESQGLSAIRKG